MLTGLGIGQDLTIRLAFALTVVSLIALISLGGNVYLWNRSEVHFVTSGSSGASTAGELSDKFVYDYITRALHTRYTWSYFDITAAHTNFKPFLHPRLQKHFEEKVAPAEAKLVREPMNKMSSGIVPITTTIVERYGLTRRVVVQGVRHLWIGGTPRQDDITVTFVLAPVTDENGWVIDIRVYDLKDDYPLQTLKR